MGLIIETDIGHDPDDLFALRYLYLKGVQIDEILINPGYEYQAALANEVCPFRTIRLGTPKKPLTQNLSVLYQKLSKNIHTATKYIDDSKIVRTEKDDVLVIGPVKQLPLVENLEINKMVFQGGFMPYSQCRPQIVLDKFEGKEKNGSFNPGGSGKNFYWINELPCQRYWVSKNICHTIELKQTKFKDPLLQMICNHLDSSKKLHDLVAAVLYLHPEIAIWYNKAMVKQSGEFTTIDGDDKVIADIDYDAFYKEIQTV